MREFQFTSKDATVQVSVLADIIDPKTEKFTIMDIRGEKGTMFVTHFPWHKGSVLDHKDIEAWYEKFRWCYKGSEYNLNAPEVGSVEMGTEPFKLTITPTITNGDEAELVVNVFNPDGILADTFILALEDSKDKEVEAWAGYKYCFSLTEDESWTSGTAPDDIVVDGNETLAAAISLPAPPPEPDPDPSPDPEDNNDDTPAEP